MSEKKTASIPPAPQRARSRADEVRERLHASEEHVKETFENVSEPVKARLEKPAAQVSRMTRWVKAFKPYRVYINFSHSDGNLRAAGMGFQALFAIFAAIWLGFSLAGIWLVGNEQLLHAIAEIINNAIPGLIGPDGVIKPQDLTTTTTTFGWTGVIAAISLLWTAISWLFYTRQAVRAIFGLSRDTTNYVLQKIRDLGLAVAFGFVLILSGVLMIVSTEAAAFVLRVLGLDQDSFWSNALTQFSGILISLLLNIVVLGTMFRVLSRVAIPWRNLFFGSLLGAATLSALSFLGGLLLGTANKNPLLATFAVFVGLLIWFNLTSRVMLLSGSWIAIGMFDKGISPRIVTPEQRAAEEAAQEHQARVIVARAELDDAKDDLARARWWQRLAAQRRVERAQNVLNDALDEGGVGGSH
ncbi:YihY/virulence factor BrkB family protein [Diaminobutyricibacter tongyongensis]